MKLHLLAPALLVVGLGACSKETSSPTASTATPPAAAAPATAQANAAPETEGLTQLPDQLSAEEIQARREAWVGGGSSNTEAADSRMAAAPVPPRE